jgi:large subunit ribosomal protein L30e
VERLLNRRRAKLVLFSRDSPSDLISEVRTLGQRKNIPMFNSSKTNIELGKLCGRPHPVSTLAILDFGSATIQQEY